MNIALSESITFTTFSPVRTPINTNSELRASLEAETHQEMLRKLSTTFGEYFTPKEQGKSDGYGDINHDNHPYFFQPLFVGEIELKSVDALLSSSEQFPWWEQCRLIRCDLHIFDDSVGVLNFDFSLEEVNEELLAQLENGTFDRHVSNLVQFIYARAVYPQLSQISNALNSIDIPNVIKPKDFKIFNDIDFKSLKPTTAAVLWTGRMAFMPASYSPTLYATLHKWVGMDDIKKKESFVLGSGNVLVNECEKASDWSRVQLVCQSYNAILYLLNTKLKEKYSEISSDTSKSVRKKKNLAGTLGQTVRALEHIEFCQLEFKDAMIGTQARRTSIMESFYRVWKLPKLEDLTIHRASLIKSRVDTILKEQQARVNRSVEYLLSAIGCLAIIDLTITLVSTSNNLEDDNIPGLFDIFKMMPHDGSAWVSIILVVMIAIYLYRIRS